MKEPGIGTNLLNPNLKLREKIVTQLVGNGVILFKHLIYVKLNASVKFS